MTKVLAHRPFLKKFLISYLLILMIPFVLNILTFHASSDVVKDYADRSNRALINQVRFVVDQRISSLENQVFQISQDKRMDSLSKQELPLNPEFHLDMVAAMKRLNSFMMLENNIAEDYYIIFLNSGYVMDGTTVIPLELFFKYNFRYSDWAEEEWREFLTSRYHSGSFLKSDEILSKNDIFQGIPFVKTIPFYFNSTNTAFILYTIREQDLFAYYYPESSSWRGEPYLESRETGELLAGSRENLFGRGIAIESVSENYGLTFGLTVPYKDAYERLVMIRKIMIVLYAAVFVAGCLAAFLLARRNANPLHSLYTMVQGDVSGGKKDGYEILNSSVQALISSNNSLENTLVDHRKVIGAEYYYRLVKYGFESPEEMESLRLYLNKPLPRGRNGILLLNIFEGQFVDSSNMLAEIKSLKLSIIDLLKDQSSYPGCWLDLDNLSIGYIFSIGSYDRDSWFEEMSREVAKLQSLLDESVDLPCYWTVGNPVNDVFNLNSSYRQARLMADELASQEKGKVYEYRNFSPSSSESSMPIDVLQKLVNLGRSGNAELALNLFRENWTENMEEKQLSVRNRQIYFMELRSLLVRIKPDLSDKPDFFDFHLKPAEHVYETVCRVLQKTAEEVKRDSQKSQDELKEKLKGYVENNYLDESLSLSSIADAFGKSESYISHFFKRYCDENFYTMLERLRMERARTLLTTTDLPIREISAGSGYSSMHSFRRAFKKVYGVSPSSFREI